MNWKVFRSAVGISVPRAYGGAGVSFATLAEVIATLPQPTVRWADSAESFLCGRDPARQRQ